MAVEQAEKFYNRSRGKASWRVIIARQDEWKGYSGIQMGG
jgi:hypothetical protein